MNSVLSLRNKLRSGKLGLWKQTVAFAVIVSFCYLLAIIVNTEISSITSQKETVAMYQVEPSVLAEFSEELNRRELPHQIVYNSDNIPYVDIMFLYGKYSIIVVDDIQTFIDFDGGGRLIAGRKPENSREVLMDIQIARNNGLKIGDFYTPNVSGGTGNLGELQIVGYFQPKAMNWRNSYVLKDPDKSAVDYRDSLSVAVKLPLEKFDTFIEKQDALVGMFPEDSVEPQSNFGSAKQMQNSRYGFIFIMGLLFTLVFLVVGFCIYHTSSIHLYHRTREYQTLAALGYMRGRLLWLVYKEYLFINLFGWFLGFSIGTTAAWMINIFYWTPNGTPALYFYPMASC